MGADLWTNLLAICALKVVGSSGGFPVAANSAAAALIYSIFGIYPTLTIHIRQAVARDSFVAQIQHAVKQVI